VQVLTGNPPTEPHVDVALLEVEQQEGSERQAGDDLVQRLRERAAEIGCDAVYIRGAAAPDGDEPALDPDARQLLARCIVFTPPHAAPEQDAEVADTQKLPAAPASGRAQP